MSFHILAYCRYCGNTADYYFLHMLSHVLRNPQRFQKGYLLTYKPQKNLSGPAVSQV